MGHELHICKGLDELIEAHYLYKKIVSDGHDKKYEPFAHNKDIILSPARKLGIQAAIFNLQQIEPLYFCPYFGIPESNEYEEFFKHYENLMLVFDKDLKHLPLVTERHINETGYFRPTKHGLIARKFYIFNP
jgi:hypothetical protein